MGVRSHVRARAVAQPRETFRPAAEGVAWQRQLRDRHAHEGTPPVPHLDLGRSRVRPVSRKLAEQVILKYEWLGTMVPTRHHFGLFFGPYCAGVTCVAVGTGTGGTGNARMFGLEPQQLAVLARGACVHWAPNGANSRLVSWTCRLLSKARTARLILAYSDTDAGEIGTIYQACNWVYIGRGAATTQFVAPNGRVFDQSIVANIKRNRHLPGVAWSAQRDALLAAGWQEQASNPKHRYVYILDRWDRALVDRVEGMRLPYPKRAGVAQLE